MDTGLKKEYKSLSILEIGKQYPNTCSRTFFLGNQSLILYFILDYEKPLLGSQVPLCVPVLKLDLKRYTVSTLPLNIGRDTTISAITISEYIGRVTILKATILKQNRGINTIEKQIENQLSLSILKQWGL